MNIINENKARLKKLFAPYNPDRGTGSLIPRFKYLGINLPIPMKGIPELKAIEKLKIKRVNKEILIAAVNQVRLGYDFEYWAYKTITIIDKKTSTEIAFKLNLPQRMLLAELEDMRQNNIPIRLIIVKARQWGGSTLTQIYIMWIQTILKTNWNSTIVGDIEAQALNIRAMYNLAAQRYPAKIGTITLKNFEGAQKNKVIEETGSRIYIGSMQKPENIRSSDIKAAHLSEIGLWKATLNKKPEDIIQSILGSIPLLPDTVLVMESTAKGVGNYFHTAYQAAKNKTSGYKPFFIPWYLLHNNTLTLPQDKWQETYQNLTDYEKFLWQQGATLQGIIWYRAKLKEFEGNTWRMQSEFPTTDIEAFQSTGNRVFPIEYVNTMRLSCTPPTFIGNIIADNTTGTQAMQNIQCIKHPQGNTKIWSMPQKTQIAHRYLVTVDIGGTSKNSDWSVIRVLDRIGLIGGGKPEAILTHKSHQEVDVVIWKAVTIATFYNNALLVIEKNSLNRKKDAGENYLAALTEIADTYPNIYKREDHEDEETAGKEVKYGFHTNRQTKPMIVKQYRAALREQSYTEHDNQVLDEADIYEEKQDGSYGNADGEGNHDDLLMATMIALHISSYVMLAPKIINRTKKRRSSKPNMANF